MTLPPAASALAPGAVLGGAGPLLPVRVLGDVVAHVGGLSRVAAEASVPSWLTVLTGGVLVGGSFLFNSLLTDHDGIRAVNGWRAVLPATDGLRAATAAALRVVGVAALALVLAAAFLGPRQPTANVAILVVWAGWWAGYAMTTYLVGNTWPALNPWRALADWLPGERAHSGPRRLGPWPAVVALLALVWVEVVSPLAQNPRALGALVAAYTVLTVAGAQRYGVDAWFETVDPVSRVFRCYGRVAPVQFTGDGVAFRLPGAALTDRAPTGDAASPAFVVALLWSTTFDGLVATPVWNDLARGVVETAGLAGAPQRALVLALYGAALVAGYVGFLAAYRGAAARSRRTADSYLAPDAIARWLAPALLPIAAGYHLAHFSGYFLSLSPALAAALATPLGGSGVARVAVLPAWFGTLQLAFVVAGHLLAVWVAHALAMELFPGVLRPIRSQYPFVVVMVAFTMTSAVVVGQPFTQPAYL